MESSQYSTSILGSKTPSEAIHCLDLRLSECREIDQKLARWFGDFNRIQTKYSSDLSKLLVDGNKLWDAREGNLGQFESVWSSLMKKVNVEIESRDRETILISDQVIEPIRRYVSSHESNLQELESLRRAADHASKKKHPGNEWDNKAPYFFEIFEKFDFNHSVNLKNSFLNFVSTSNDSLGSVSKENEELMKVLLGFDPNDETTRFAQLAAHTNMSKTFERTQKKEEKREKKILEKSEKDDKKSEKKREKNKLKNKMGSIFRKKKTSSPKSSVSSFPHESSSSVPIREEDESIVSESPSPTPRRVQTGLGAPTPPPSSRQDSTIARRTTEVSHQNSISSPPILHPDNMTAAAPPVRTPTSPLAVRQEPPPSMNYHHAPPPPISRKTQPERVYSMASSMASTPVLQPNMTGMGNASFEHPDLTLPGLNASVVEIFNASFKDGSVAKCNVVGEIAFCFIGDIPKSINLQLANAPFSKVLVNPAYIAENAHGESKNFTLFNLNQINLTTVGGIKYMVNNVAPPVVVEPIWKFEPNQASVLISIRSALSVTLSNVLLMTSIEGADSESAATKPQGSFNREKNRITWNLPQPLMFHPGSEEVKIIARFKTNGLAREKSTQLRFTINDSGNSKEVGCKLDLSFLPEADPFASDDHFDQWQQVPYLKTIMSGKYSSGGL